jgi:hypothetical protein
MLILGYTPSYSQDDESKTFKGYDLDTTLINEPQFGLQMMNICNFIDYFSDNAKTLGNAQGYSSRYFMRADYWLGIALPDHTNLYGLMSFCVTKEDNATPSAFTYTVLNMEVEHFFNDIFKIRFGRLVNKTSQSMFFARMALGESDAHVVGRSPYVNDACEIDVNLQSYGLPVLMFGVKPIYNTFDLNGVYLGAHQDFSKGFGSCLITSLNRTRASEIASLPGFINDRWYFAWEYELSVEKKKWNAFANASSYINYVGKGPHMSGNKDLLKGYVPMIADPEDSYRSSLTLSTGMCIKPAMINKSLSNFKKIGLEYECTGLAGDLYTSHQLFFYSKMLFFKNIRVNYFFNPQFIRLREQTDIKTSATSTIQVRNLGACTHDFRISVLFGRFGRFL